MKTLLRTLIALALVGSIWGPESTAFARESRSSIVLVHGAWHGAWAWYRVKAMLESAGYSVTALDLPSHGIDGTNPGTVTLADYTSAVVNVLDASSAPVILVGHSMGGIVVSAAAEARPEKIAKLVYLSAFLLPNGKSIVDVTTGDAHSLLTGSIVFTGPPGTVDVTRDRVDEIFYGSSSSANVTLARLLLKPNPLAPVVTPLTVTDGRFGSVPRFYITTLKDRAISADVQRRMYTETPCEKVYAINTDHSAFFSRPRKLVADLINIERRGHRTRPGSTSRARG
jgi:pimeloyl-ACP methyl ester carboxylesterase